MFSLTTPPDQRPLPIYAKQKYSSELDEKKIDTTERMHLSFSIND